MWSWLRQIPIRSAEARHHDDFGFADLKDKQQQADDEDQQDANRKDEGVSFHGKLFLFGRRHLQIQDVAGDGLLQIEYDHIMRVGGQHDVLARIRR